jgi:ABC-type dipeptide/oligopeptide/nickel transport system permease subunit
VPGGALFFTVFALNFVGDAMRSRFDVREAQL